MIGGRLVLTAAHAVDYLQDLGDGGQVLVRDIGGTEFAAGVVLVCAEPSRVDLALLEISDPRFDEHLPPVRFARVNRDSPAPVPGCWAVGFPRFGEAGPMLPEGSRRETWQVRGEILPGGKLRAGLLSLQVTSIPQPLPASLGGSAWEGMSGTVVFATDPDDGELAVGIVSMHHRPEGQSALTVVPVTAFAGLPAAARWWHRLGVTGLDALPVLPRQASPVAGQQRPGRDSAPVGRLLGEVTDPFALEVHRPVQPDDPPPGLPVLPAYVPREHDEVLRRVVRAAAEGRSGIAVLVGGSSTGKTRACWEALGVLRDLPQPWRVWHPIDPSRPDAALAELPGIGPRTVVWLNEAQFYLQVAEGGLGERVAAGLRELLRDAGRAPVLMLATLWPQFWDVLTARPADGGDPHAQARELLAGHDITVPAAFTPAQMGQLAGAGDARLALAAQSAAGGQVVQFLAGAPELLARYRNAPPAARGLIEAAMDARRLGMGATLPQAFLEAAAPGYLTDAEWDALQEDWLEQALAYAAVPCKGARGPLTRIRPRPASPDTGHHAGQPHAGTSGGPGYRLADYLDQHGRAQRASQIPPAEFWAAAAAHTAPADQAGLGDAAHARGLYRDAAQLHKNAAAAGNHSAAFYLAGPPDYLRADGRPVYWAAAHAALDDPYSVARLLDSLRAAGAHHQAAALLARDPAAHAALDDPGGVAVLLDSLRAAGAHHRAAARLLGRLREAGAHDQAAALLARDPAAHAALDDPYRVASLLDSLRAAGAHDQAAALASRAAAHAALDDPFRVASLLDSLQAAGAHDQAAALASRAAALVALDDPHGVADLLDWLREAGAHDQAAALLARDPAAHAPLDNPGGVGFLLDRLRVAGAQEQVAALLARDPAAHAPLDDPYGVGFLLDRLRVAGAQEQVAALLARDPAAYAALGDLGGVAVLLDSLREAGAHDQAAALLARDPAAHAALDDPYRVAVLLDRLREAGAHHQAALLARDPAAHAALEDPGRVAVLLDSLQAAGAHEQAAALLARDPAAHAALDDPYGVARLLDRLRAAGAYDQAAALASRAAAHAALDDPDFVALLLDSLREAGAHDQAAALTDRLPAAGMFRLFLKQQGHEDQFRFGRQADGSPAAPWGWEDLD
jgi:uncharacterized protein YidB (DUF937 family)